MISREIRHFYHARATSHSSPLYSQNFTLSQRHCIVDIHQRLEHGPQYSRTSFSLSRLPALLHSSYRGDSLPKLIKALVLCSNCAFWQRGSEVDFLPSAVNSPTRVCQENSGSIPLKELRRLSAAACCNQPRKSARPLRWPGRQGWSSIGSSFSRGTRRRVFRHAKSSMIASTVSCLPASNKR